MHLMELLECTIQFNVSDLHLSPNLPPMVRIDGDLVPLENMPALDADTVKTMIHSVMSNKQQKQFAKTLELDFAISLSNAARFRVNAFYQMHGMAAVFRIIPNNIPMLDQLGLPTIFKNLLDLPNGLILVTGPTGSGKSTTLAAMVDHINAHQPLHIITIEDPIEFEHKSKRSLVNQRELHRDTHDFASALRSVLREDPDVILLGEMRDLKTMRLALTAAETGHLVLSTLHTSSAHRTISRIIDVFPSNEKDVIRHMLAESLQAIICQNLIKKKGGGRIAALEIMIGTPAIRNLIRENKIPQIVTAMQTGREYGMCTREQYLQLLCSKGLIK